MRTDVITVSSNGKQMSAALEQVEKMASFKGLSSKGTLQLRLLTEEMMGMMRSITGEKEGQFWIEDEDGVYQLHLKVSTRMNSSKREKLLSAATTGKNESARGLMGRLRDFFEQGDNLGALPYFMSEADDPTAATMRWEWSMNAYQNTLQGYMEKDQRAREAWDELEKSVVTHVADEIKVFIRGGQTEMTIIKKLG